MNRESFEQLLNGCPKLSEKKIFIWGAGNTAELYQEGLQRLEAISSYCFEGYGDNSKEKQGTMFHGKKVYSADEIAQIKDAVVLILTPQKRVSDAVGEQLKALGIEYYILDEVIFKGYKDELLAIYDLLDDELSKKVYSEVVRLRMINGQPNEDIFTGDTYFCLPPFKRNSMAETFVDCGGYVGDTLEKYLWMRGGEFRRIISFEPDKNNFEAMSVRIERLKKEWNISDADIVAYPFGIGDVDSEASVNLNDKTHGLGSKISMNKEETDFLEGERIRIINLDSFMSEPIGFLKADIESYEYKMIIGAEKLIKEQKPLLAICIYHNAIDFFQIPLLIHELVPDYHLAVRHHSYSLDETVLYAFL